MTHLHLGSLILQVMLTVSRHSPSKIPYYHTIPHSHGNPHTEHDPPPARASIIGLDAKRVTGVDRIPRPRVTLEEQVGTNTTRTKEKKEIE